MATNWEKYFGTPERAALTLCDIEIENQFSIRHGIKTNVEPLDENGKLRDFNELMEDAITMAVTPVLLLFEYMGQKFIVDGEEQKKKWTFAPTTAHEFLEWLQEEVSEL